MAHRSTAVPSSTLTRRPRDARNGPRTRLLADDVLVLSLDPASGRTLGRFAALNCGLAGALLAELALSGRLQWERSRVLGAQSPTRGGAAALTDVADTIGADTRRRPLTFWVHRLQGRKLRRKLLRRAVDIGELRTERRPGPFGVPTTRYFAADPGAAADRLAELRTAARSGRAATRTGVLLGLLVAMGTDARLIPDVTRSRRRAAIAEAVSRDPVAAEITAVVSGAVGTVIRRLRVVLAAAVAWGLTRPFLPG